MGLVGWISVRKGHAPLRDIVEQIHRISASQLNSRLSPDNVPVELTDLAVSFNDMLQRVEESFLRLSNFSADIAHELRTPMTNLLTQTQVALSQNRSSEEYREVLYSSIEEYERITQMISDMLFLAKADNGLFHLNNVTINLETEINQLFEFYEAWAEEHGVALTLEGSASVSGDQPMLRRALSNLVSNAIRHTPRGNTVKITLEHNAEKSIVITVDNPGISIPPEHLSKVFDRFYRVDASRQREGEGAGLGLAITKSIIEIHRGTVTSLPKDDGARFQVILPG